MGNPFRPGLCLVVLLAACLTGDPRPRAGTRCGSDADCAEDLVCRYGRCRARCELDRDCPEGERCLPVGTQAGHGVCSAPEDACIEDADCDGSLTCGPGGFCVVPCDDFRCLPGWLCEAQGAGEPVCVRDPCFAGEAPRPTVLDELELTVGPTGVAGLTAAGGEPAGEAFALGWIVDEQSFAIRVGRDGLPDARGVSGAPPEATDVRARWIAAAPATGGHLLIVSDGAGLWFETLTTEGRVFDLPSRPANGIDSLALSAARWESGWRYGLAWLASDRTAIELGFLEPARPGGSLSIDAPAWGDPAGCGRPAVTLVDPEDAFVVVWSQGSSLRIGVSAFGWPLGPPEAALLDSEDRQPHSPALAWDGERLGMAWVESAHGSSLLRFALISPAWELDEGTVVDVVSGDVGNPSLASLGPGRFLVAFEFGFEPDGGPRVHEIKAAELRPRVWTQAGRGLRLDRRGARSPVAVAGPGPGGAGVYGVAWVEWTESGDDAVRFARLEVCP